MVKFKPGRMQIYFPGAVSTRKELILRSGPPWMGKAELLSLPQLKACYALAKIAHEYGYEKTGKVKYKGLNISMPAYIVALGVPKGVGVHGGKKRTERAEERHKVTKLVLKFLEAMIEEKGGTVPKIEAPPGITASTK